MPQNGCVPSEVWGGGCSWGPDVTQVFLNRHNMQLISRSHECKQDGLPQPQGFITMEGFRQMWELLSAYLKMEITDEAISDLSITIDTNREGNTDEFKEAFLLTDNKSRLDRVTSWGPPLT
uniref:serine/threonine-protein phosphatase with EF-hands 1-like isoform X3 n=1 Tax=Oncorhynchus gorbuscha TaxID=8017 RepID=UPI001EAF61F6|nr:serine/threonine-protein phosphatase with EF-hands 1-like isoform X3 [Oncorhynchus gorbuscha]